MSAPDEGRGGADTSQTESALAGQIDELLSNMGNSAATLAGEGMHRPQDSARADGAEPEAGIATAAPLNPTEVESLSAQIEALVDEVAAARRGPAPSNRPELAGRDPEPSGTPAADSSAAITGVEAVQVENSPTGAALDAMPTDRGGPLGADAPDAAAHTPPATPAPEVDLRELDAQLAARAAGTIEPIGPVTPEPVASALPSPQVDVAPAAEAAPATPAVASNPVIAVPVAALTVGVPQPAVAPPGGPSILARAAGSLRPAAARVLAISARTLERSPKVARDTAGWIALVTVFFASCMWAIVLFFRSTPVPETYGVPSAVLEPGEATPQGRPRPREEHAGQPHAEESHADDHGAAEDDHGGGGGDGHGGGH